MSAKIKDLNLNNISKNNKGSAIFLVVLLLAGVLTVSLGAASLIVSGIAQGRTQTYSTKAYFAAEAGVERVLWEVRKNGADFSGCDVDDYIVFDNTNNPPNPAVCDNILQSYNLSNAASYYVIYKSSSPITFQSVGSYQQTIRSVEVSY